MKMLRRNEDIYFKEYEDTIRVIHLDQNLDGYLELEGIACWILKDALTEPISREDLIELAQEDFEELPSDYAENINQIVDELIENHILVEA